MKILLTGGNGFFSSHFAKRYQDVYECVRYDVDRMDVTDKKAVDDIILEENPDIIIHAGAVAETAFCDAHRDLAFKINVEGALNIAEAARKCNAKLVFTSSEQVFNGNQNSGPFAEEDLAVPNTVYGETKLAAERKVREILDEVWVVRFTWMYGMPERDCPIGNGILWDVVSKVLKGEKIKASKREFRGMTNVNEMVKEFPKLFDLPYGTYHLGAENDLNRYEVILEILKGLRLNEERIGEILEEDTEKYRDKNRDVRLNTSKAADNGFKFLSTKEGIHACLKEYRIGE